jgi:hypothetical protein
LQKDNFFFRPKQYSKKALVNQYRNRCKENVVAAKTQLNALVLSKGEAGSIRESKDHFWW